MADHYERLLAESTWHEAEREWTHNPCGTALMGKQVHFSVWDGPFPLTGSGDVKIITVPYCPACEPVPSDFGILSDRGLSRR